jgi:hypothetical protein
MDSKAQRKAIQQLVSAILAIIAARLAIWIVDQIMKEK